MKHFASLPLILLTELVVEYVIPKFFPGHLPWHPIAAATSLPQNADSSSNHEVRRHESEVLISMERGENDYETNHEGCDNNSQPSPSTIPHQTADEGGNHRGNETEVSNSLERGDQNASATSHGGSDNNSQLTPSTIPPQNADEGGNHEVGGHETEVYTSPGENATSHEGSDNSSQLAPSPSVVRTQPLLPAMGTRPLETFIGPRQLTSGCPPPTSHPSLLLPSFADGAPSYASHMDAHSDNLWSLLEAYMLGSDALNTLLDAHALNTLMEAHTLRTPQLSDGGIYAR